MEPLPRVPRPLRRLQRRHRRLRESVDQEANVSRSSTHVTSYETNHTARYDQTAPPPTEYTWRSFQGPNPLRSNPPDLEGTASVSQVYAADPHLVHCNDDDNDDDDGEELQDYHNATQGFDMLTQSFQEANIADNEQENYTNPLLSEKRHRAIYSPIDSSSISSSNPNTKQIQWDIEDDRILSNLTFPEKCLELLRIEFSLQPCLRAGDCGRKWLIERRKCLSDLGSRVDYGYGVADTRGEYEGMGYGYDDGYETPSAAHEQQEQQVEAESFASCATSNSEIDHNNKYCYYSNPAYSNDRANPSPYQNSTLAQSTPSPTLSPRFATSPVPSPHYGQAVDPHRHHSTMSTHE